MRPLLVIGARGTLGHAFIRLCTIRRLAVVAVTRDDGDLTDEAWVRQLCDVHAPWGIINTAGYVRVDDAESDHHECWKANVDLAWTVAKVAAERAIPFVTFSSDLVFDGSKTVPYQEGDVPAPLSAYGRSKAEAEAIVMETHPASLVIRTSAFFGPWDTHNFLATTINDLASGRSVSVAADVTVSPTYVPDLVHACLDLLIDGESGLWHLSNVGEVSWATLARAAADAVGVSARRLRAVGSDGLEWRASRPRYSALGSERGTLLPALEDALGRWVNETQRRSA